MDAKFAFIDRDGTIIKDIGYIHKIEDLEFLPGAIAGLQHLVQLGFKLIIVTNQAGIARGKYSPTEAQIFNNEVVHRLAIEDIPILATYMCGHHPDVTGDCHCRKPNPGMVQQAINDHGVNPNQAIFIGDKDCDIELGAQFSATTFLVDNQQYEVRSQPSHRIKSLEEIGLILASNAQEII